MITVIAIILYTQLFIPPPGTTPLDENKFIDKNLITYADYQDFLFFIKKSKVKKDYEDFIPKDTLVTFRGKKLWGNPKFLDFPIIGLERKQLTEYCKWRSDLVNSWKNHSENRKCNFEYWNQFDRIDPNNVYEIRYSLPSKEDLMTYKTPKEKFWLNEWTEQGHYNRKKSKKISNSVLKVSRCIAVYHKI